MSKMLQNDGMFVRLSISDWSATKKDTKVSKEVEANHGAYEAGRYTKDLLSRTVGVSPTTTLTTLEPKSGKGKGKSAEAIFTNPLRAITTLRGSIRTWFYANTLPWEKNQYLLPMGRDLHGNPSPHYFAFVKKFSEFNAEWDKLVNEFLDKYPVLVDEARGRLNTMFSESDYPAVDKLRDKFALKISFSPIPDLDDFRCRIPEEEIAKVKAEFVNTTNDRLRDIVDVMLNRIREAVQHLANTLYAYDSVNEKGERNDKRLHDSTVGNICALIEVIPHLNLVNDPHVDEVVAMIEPLCVNTKMLKAEPDLRREVYERASKILPLI